VRGEHLGIVRPFPGNLRPKVVLDAAEVDLSAEHGGEAFALRVVVDAGKVERNGALIRPEDADALDHPLAASGSNELTGIDIWLAHARPLQLRA
jgi:hypothetical protein